MPIGAGTVLVAVHEEKEKLEVREGDDLVSGLAG
jgi:hypothetical protein